MRYALGPAAPVKTDLRMDLFAPAYGVLNARITCRLEDLYLIGADVTATSSF